jgi:phosphoglycolate phosphatase-like HAD superfamily hydrolase
MDGGDMLDNLLPHIPKQEKKRILKVQEETYRRDYLQLGHPFSRVREVFAAIKKRDLAIGIATSCKGDELREYDRRMHVLELVDAVACGDDVRKGKPHPDLYYSGLKKIGLKQADQAMCVGDSPFDAMAAKLLGMRAVGVLTGGFTSATLATAGCNSIFRDVSELEDIGQLKSR